MSEGSCPEESRGDAQLPDDAAAREGPRLSVVATSRNDDHGGHLVERMQWFVDGLAYHADRTQTDVELIMVEWNPPPERPPLAEILRWPARGEHLETRILTVPPEAHERIVGPGRIPMMQMLAKNAGIRRAEAPLTLATNIDILLDPKLFDMSLEVASGRVLRADRYDVEFPFPDLAGVPDALAFCESHPVRYARRDGIYYPGRGRVLPMYQSIGDLASTLARRGTTALKRTYSDDPGEAPGRWSKGAASETAGGPSSPAKWARAGAERADALRTLVTVPKLHTNACGDFTLLTTDDWHTLRGYPEWIVHSWYLDSVLLHQADGAGLSFVEASPPAVAYHMDHSTGSGWSPEAHASYLGGISQRKMPYLSPEEFRRHQRELACFRSSAATPVYNDDRWGLADEDVAETRPAA